MEFDWDEAKRVSNLRKHGVDFVRVLEFDWETAVRFEDNRQPYGEQRWLALGKIGVRLHARIYTKRGRRTRIITLRKANNKETKRYEAAS